MLRTRRFVYVDGREVEAASALGFFEALRRTERAAPEALDDYLAVLRTRARLFYGVDLDIGEPRLELATRCASALSALMSHGWVRVKPDRVSATGPQLMMR
jgi:hypothetical protein